MELSKDYDDRRPATSSELDEWNRIALYESGLGYVGDENFWSDPDTRAATKELLADIGAWLRSLLPGARSAS